MLFDLHRFTPPEGADGWGVDDAVQQHARERLKSERLRQVSGQVRGDHAKPAVLDRLALAKRRQVMEHRLGRYGKAHALSAARAGEDQHIDADQFAVDIYQIINRRILLNDFDRGGTRWRLCQGLQLSRVVINGRFKCGEVFVDLAGARGRTGGETVGHVDLACVGQAESGYI